MKFYALFLAGVLFAGPAMAAEKTYTYYGEWVTTNRKLNGNQTAVVTWKGGEKWSGRFYGTWQGVKYDYTVDFAGPYDNLKGTAQIDGAQYEWKGTITKEMFKATFTGSRYTGYFNMPRKRE